MTTRNDRPVFSRLPVRGYQDNPVADALTRHYDEKLVEVGSAVESLHTRLDPLTTEPKYLDWLAFLVGMVEPYYSPRWPIAVKRKAIANANYIFSNRGTFNGLDAALHIHDFDYSIYSSDDLRFSFILSDSTRFGLSSQTVFIRLPLEYARTSYPFLETQRAIRNYTAIVTPVKACYEKFYLGFSQFSDPLF